MKKGVILVAGGAGIRMGNPVPKQFLLLNQVPVLMHSIRRFYDSDPAIMIVVVLPQKEIQRWNKLIEEFHFTIAHTIVEGGSTRFQSVKNGLSNIPDGMLIAIHDGVRPLCTVDLIRKCFDEAEKFSNAIPAIPISDSVREKTTSDTRIVDRTNLMLIQTPQCFDSTL